MENILACDWLGVVSGPSYKQPPFPFYHDSYWIRTPPSTPTEQARESMKYFIRLSVFQHLGSDTFRGRLELGGTPFKGIKGEFAETAVIKYAGTEIAIERLEHEHQVLQKLTRAGVTDIPKVIGLFFYNTMEKNYSQRMAALVMEDAGEPVGHVNESNLSNCRRHMCVSNFPVRLR